jgi:hypothetical protein
MNDGEVQMVCPTCGVAYCLPARFQAERREDHATWYCPNGHPLHYPQETEKERTIRKLRERVRQLETQLEWRLEIRDDKIARLEHQVRSLRSRLSWARRRAA